MSDGAAIRVITLHPDQVGIFGDSRAILPTLLIDMCRAEISEPTSGATIKIYTNN